MIIPHEPGVWTVGGPAGSGKTTLIARLLKEVHRARPLRRIVTRTKRATDNPAEYVYMDREEFDRRAAAGEFFNPVEIHGNMNGVFMTELDEIFASNYVVTADLNAVNTEKLYLYGASLRSKKLFRSVFLCLDDEYELLRRLLERGEKDVERRLVECRMWAAHARASFIPFHFIDASQTKDAVFDEAIRYFTSPT